MGGANEVTPLLNGAKEKLQKQHKWLPTFFFNIFFACVSFSIIMPSLAPYIMQMGAPLDFLPWVVAVYSGGEILGSLVFGWIYEKSFQVLPGGQGPRLSMISCIVVGLVGSAMYVVADWIESPWLVFWARGVQGLWTGGQQCIEQAYLSAVVEKENRTELTATLSSFAVLGFIMGPSFGALFAGLGDGVYVGPIELNMYNAPGIFIFGVTVIMLVITLANFDGSVREDVKQAAEAAGNGDATGLVAGRSYVGLYICLWIFFVHYYSFAVQETVTTPLAMHLYDWTPLEVNLLFVGAGLLSLLTSLCVKYLTRVFADSTLLVFSLVVGLAGCVLLVDVPVEEPVKGAGYGNRVHGDQPSLSLWRFLVGFALITVAFPFGRNVTLGVFSNVLGPGPQGLWMGVMLAVGAIPRTLGPFSAIWVLEEVNWQTYLEFGSCAILFMVGLMVAVTFLQHLKAHEDEEKALLVRKSRSAHSQEWAQDSPAPRSPMLSRRSSSMSIE
uniref:Major facilitator superfamily (MFS) profile domain-containing protein n=1 Tax=Phaeomonas parva TaxID=124430 RepID=A0A6U4JKV3_9STRA|mmetsp:Transcript_44065/g.138463  ORF Transcript_44065/g.138463 Transcript_44065/m.138463 type:complete len:498 (+) Transcript_44065:178-1671(+)